MVISLSRRAHCRTVALWAAGICAASACIGWPAGYDSLASYLAFWLSVTGVLSFASTMIRRVYQPRGVADAIIETGVGAFATIVAAGLILGVLGIITPIAYATMAAVLLGSALIVDSAHSPAFPVAIADLPLVAVGMTAALLAFMLAFAATHAPMTLYDSLSYHLYFPARWLQEHRLSIIPTPFSDEAQAYTPAHGELFLLWLMAPFHGDLVARAGQFPFALLGAVTVYALARHSGARREHAVYPAVFFLFCRQVFEQAMGANVDLICAAMFLASLYLGILAVERDQPRDWLLWGISFGLYAGTKYLAVIYAPIFLVVVFARGRPKHVAWALPGIVVFGFAWYLRNWIVTGSPIYPASLQVAGVTLARGAFTRAAMLNSVFHTDDFALFPTMAAHLFGPTLLVVWIPFAIVGAIRSARLGWWPNGVLLLVVVLMIPLYWFGSPVNIDSRFLLPGIGPALLPLAFVFSASRRGNMIFTALYTVALAWIVVGVHASIPATVPWFMVGWRALDGLVRSPFVVAYGGLAVGFGMAWWCVRRAPRWAVRSLAALVAATAVALALGTSRWCSAGCEYLDTTSPFIRVGLLDSWRWLGGNVHGAVIAYTGINLPYPLFGDRLTNRVLYVNIDAHRRWRLHDYDRAYRDGRFAPAPPRLAVSSGELRPVVDGAGPREDASRPRYERMEGFRETWIANLRALGVTHVFVSALSAYELDYMWHNDGGFPIEDEWARTDPRSLHLLYQNPQVRIYAVALPAKTGT